MTRPKPNEEPIGILVARVCHRFSRLARQEVTLLTLKRKDPQAPARRRLFLRIDNTLAKLTALYPRRA